MNSTQPIIREAETGIRERNSDPGPKKPLSPSARGRGFVPRAAAGRKTRRGGDSAESVPSVLPEPKRRRRVPGGVLLFAGGAAVAAVCAVFVLLAGALAPLTGTGETKEADRTPEELSMEEAVRAAVRRMRARIAWSSGKLGWTGPVTAERGTGDPFRFCWARAHARMLETGRDAVLRDFPDELDLRTDLEWEIRTVSGGGEVLFFRLSDNPDAEQLDPGTLDPDLERLFWALFLEDPWDLFGRENGNRDFYERLNEPAPDGADSPEEPDSPDGWGARLIPANRSGEEGNP